MLKTEFNIGKHAIRNYGKPFIIAEAGSNHNQSYETAIKLIDLVAQAGAHAVKFQLFQAEKLYPDDTELYKIFKSIELNQEWVPRLKRHASNVGVEFLASPFDKDSANLLESIGVPAYKIASSEAVNLPLLAHIAQKNKPLLIATGMCDLVDVVEAVEFCNNMGASSIVLMQCGSVYPLEPSQVHLRVMDSFSTVFQCPVGFSDHTLGMGAAIAAVARGACIVEKHFTLDKSSKGPDHFYALNPEELMLFVRLISEAYVSLGSSEKNLLSQEKEFGRREGLYASRDLKQGKLLEDKDVVTKRPALGLRSRHLKKIIGGQIQTSIEAGMPIQWEHVRFNY